jgi:hypothetical protein
VSEALANSKGANRRVKIQQVVIMEIMFYIGCRRSSAGPTTTVYIENRQVSRNRLVQC